MIALKLIKADVVDAQLIQYFLILKVALFFMNKDFYRRFKL